MVKFDVLEYYQYVACYFPATCATKICDTVEFMCHSILFPKVKPKDFLAQLAQDIITLLTQPLSSITLLLDAGDPARNALLELATQLGKIDKLLDLIEQLITKEL